MKNYYKILNISYDSDSISIKRAYRQLALQYHPDKNKNTNAAEIFLLITEAYEILYDKNKRTDYDFLYKKHFLDGDIIIYKEINYKKQQEKWTDFGQERARRYSEMNYEDYAKRILDEIKIGVNYLPHIVFIILIAIGLFGLISVLPKVFSDRNAPEGMGVFLLFTIIGWIVFAYYLFNKMQKQYSEERNEKFRK